MLVIGDDEQRLEPPQHAIGAPVFGQLDRGPRQIRWIALELLLEFLEQREGIGGCARESGEDLPVGFHDGLTDRDLAVAADGDFAVLADAENRRAMHAVHPAPCSLLLLRPSDAPDDKLS